ncbi:MAG: hypothetical protein MI892_27825, partial [Desulfobacterales bacterium]|nr:hypothetical protein [Desulfobacterales bacterium]
MLVVTFFPLNYLHEKEKQVVHQSVNDFNMIQVLLLQDQINIGNFISYELNNADFFLTSESDYLNEHYSHRDSIRSIINTLINKTRIEQAPYLTSLNNIATNYNSYCQIIDSIVYKTYQRGYQNYGLLGKLSSYIYQLENIQRINSNELNQIKLLRSSYCNTGSSKNAEALILHTGSLLTKNNTHQEIKLVLENYLQTFNHLVELDKDLGLYSVSGLKEQYVSKSSQIRNDIGATIQIVKNFQKVQLRRLNIFFGIIVVLCIIATFLYSIRTSRYLVKNLEKLNRYISHIASRGFTDIMKVDLSGSSKEIQLIYQEFRNMIAQLRIHEKMRDRALREAEINMISVDPRRF